MRHGCNPCEILESYSFTFLTALPVLSDYSSMSNQYMTL